jgi:hypothetical protein
MNAEFRQQEREIDRGLTALATNLRAPAPRPERIADIKAAMSAEAQRLRRRKGRLVALRPLVGIAAGLLLALVLSLPGGTRSSERMVAFDESPGVVFADWVDALGESREQFTRLLDAGWSPEGFGPGSEENGAGRDPLDSLEESLESFEKIVGA